MSDAQDESETSLVAHQGELPLPAPLLRDDQPPIPARMINEFQYCPRLAWLEWVEGEWADNADTVDGKRVHARVDKRTGRARAGSGGDADAMPAAEDLEADDRLHARSVMLASRALGVVAKLDLIEAEDGWVVPVDYKRGKRPHIPAGAHEAERVQLCLQGLLLQEHGYRCAEGALYFRESRERVKVAFDDALCALTRAAVNGTRLMVAGGRIPPPTEEMRKCPRCSLVGICLPDEVRALSGRDIAPRPVAAPKVEALPVYVQAGHGKIAKSGETLEITVEDQPTHRVRLIEVSDLVLFGNIYVTTPCQMALMQRDIPITWHSHGGWFSGHTVGVGHKNVELRTAQYRQSFDTGFCLRFARDLVAAKIRNARTMLRRNRRAAPANAAEDPGGVGFPDGAGGLVEPVDCAIEALDGSRPEALRAEATPAPVAPAVAERVHEALKRAEQKARTATDMKSLLGIEGTAAALYFGAFSSMIRAAGTRAGGAAMAEGFAFDFHRRNRRPPADPVNAMLSFAYALLTRLFTTQLSGIGLDPYRGFYHQPRYGRPGLALDMMEPYRPLIADSAVLMAINNGEVKPDQFVQAAGAVNMAQPARKALIAAFERRLAQEMTHPAFGYVVSWRQALHIQARLLARYLTGELPSLPHLTPR